MSDVGWGAIGAAIGAFLTGLFAWLTQHRRSSSDVEIAALAEWKELYSALSRRLSDVEREFAEYRLSMARDFEEIIEKHSAEREEMRKTHRAEMKALRELNEGLQRQIAANSQSTAHLLGSNPVPRNKDGGNGK